MASILPAPAQRRGTRPIDEGILLRESNLPSGTGRVTEDDQSQDPAAPQTASHNPTAAIAILLVAVIALFGVQEWVTTTWGEPYPGLGMPSFTGPTGDPITRRIATIEVEFVNGETAAITERNLVGHGDARPTDVVQSRYWHDIERVGSQEFVPASEETIELARARMPRLFPGRIVVELRVTWTRESVEPDGTRLPLN